MVFEPCSLEEIGRHFILLTASVIRATVIMTEEVTISDTSAISLQTIRRNIQEVFPSMLIAKHPKLQH
jgi:hypothetical protein